MEVMKPYVDVIVSILTLLTLAWGLYFAIRRFGLKRERFSFLRLTVDAKALKDAGDLVLVVITVVPANKVMEADSDLEQINYLDEFQDPDTDFRNVDFWLEPRESYDQPVFRVAAPRNIRGQGLLPGTQNKTSGG